MNVWTHALSTVLAERVPFVKLPLTGQCVAVQVVGLVTHTQNVTNVG